MVWRRWVLAGSLALVVAGAWVGWSGRGGGAAAARVEVRTALNDTSLAVAHNSPSVAVHPSGSPLVVANRVDAPDFGCALSASHDGGGTWEPVPLTPGLATVNCFWPRVAFDAEGDLLVLYTPLGGPNLLPVGAWLQRYDGLAPAGNPTPVAGDLAFHARMALAGPSLWVSWLQAGPATADNPLGFEPGDNHIVVARSDDGGRSFATPVRVSEPQRRVIQPTVLAWGDGELFVGALDLGDDVLNYRSVHDGETPPDPALRWQVLGWASGDGGRSFSGPVVVGADLPVPQLIIADLGPTPGFARDPVSGRLYATWDAGRGNARDVFLSTSDDGGRSWGRPRAIGPTGGSQHLPAVSVASDGRVDLLFYDRGRDPDDRFAEAVLAISWDGGETTIRSSLSARLFDTHVGLGMQQGVPLLGDELAVASLTDAAVAFWTDTSRGRALVENVQDLLAARVELERPGGRRGGQVMLGTGAAVAGLLAAALVAARRGRPGRAVSATGRH